MQRVDAVIVTSSDATHPDMVRRLGWDLEGHDVEIIVAPSLANIAGPRVHIRPVAGLPLLHVEKPAYRGGARWAKGTLDRVGALVLLILWARRSSWRGHRGQGHEPGGVFFVQERVGRDGKTFGMIKFRTMVDGADEMLDELTADTGNAVMFKMRDDPRVTRSASTAPLLPRRAAAADQRRQGRHEPGRPAATAGVGGLGATPPTRAADCSFAPASPVRGRSPADLTSTGKRRCASTSTTSRTGRSSATC